MLKMRIQSSSIFAKRECELTGTVQVFDCCLVVLSRPQLQVQNHTTEIDKYVTRCDHRINLIISQADSDWPSPRTITSLSSVPSNLTSVPILLTRKAHSEEHASAGPKSTGSLFALMTKRVHVLIHHYLCRHGFMKTAEHLKQSQSLNVSNSANKSNRWCQYEC